jgi:hypothetical protein
MIWKCTPRLTWCPCRGWNDKSVTFVRERANTLSKLKCQTPH